MNKELLTTAQIATHYGVIPRRILAIAKDRGIDGTKIGRMIFWTKTQRRNLKPRSCGAAGHVGA